MTFKWSWELENENANLILHDYTPHLQKRVSRYHQFFETNFSGKIDIKEEEKTFGCTQFV